MGILLYPGRCSGPHKIWSWLWLQTCTAASSSRRNTGRQALKAFTECDCLALCRCAHFVAVDSRPTLLDYYKRNQGKSTNKHSSLLFSVCQCLYIPLASLLYLLLSMKTTGKSLNSEISQSKSLSSSRSAYIDFMKIIEKQQEVIQSLHSQILLLKSYITIQKISTSSDAFCGENSTISTISINDSSLNRELEESVSHGFKNYEKIIREITQALELKDVDFDDSVIVESIKRLKESATRKQEPIFVERVKEIKVPITVERIVEKVVFVEKIVERPVQKEHRGYTEKSSYENEEQECVLNKTYSEKNFAKKTSDNREEKPLDRSKYEPYRRQAHGNLLKKRGQKTFRRDYY